MAAVQCCGLDLMDGLTDGDVPVAALVVVKVLSEDGQMGFVCLATEGLTSVEALGMANLSVFNLEQSLREERQ